MKSCCVTGHRTIAEEEIKYVWAKLRCEIEQAVADGFTRFLSGFAEGTDLIFAAIVTEVKKDNPAITLEAAITTTPSTVNLPD